jgi:hypothetical protein
MARHGQRSCFGFDYKSIRPPNFTRLADRRFDPSCTLTNLASCLRVLCHTAPPAQHGPSPVLRARSRRVLGMAKRVEFGRIRHVSARPGGRIEGIIASWTGGDSPRWHHRQGFNRRRGVSRPMTVAGFESLPPSQNNSLLKFPDKSHRPVALRVLDSWAGARQTSPRPRAQEINAFEKKELPAAPGFRIPTRSFSSPRGRRLRPKSPASS